MLDVRLVLGLGAVTVLAMTTGCGGSQSAITAPVAMPQDHAVATSARRPVANPTSLNFYSRHPLKFTAQQTGYDGRFTVSDSTCVDLVSVRPTTSKGPSATFKVTPIESPSGGFCVVTVANDQGRKAKVTISNPGY
jgi:hypothetical protein